MFPFPVAPQPQVLETDDELLTRLLYITGDMRLLDARGNQLDVIAERYGLRRR